jgi:hypothetical protein
MLTAREYITALASFTSGSLLVDLGKMQLQKEAARKAAP